MTRTVLITGAAGFIGSNLVKALLHRDYRVVGYDNLSFGNLDNLSGCGSPAFRFVQGDVMNLEQLEAACEGCDSIVHLAAHKIPRYSDAIDTLEINSLGTRHVLQAAAKHGRRVVAASTSDVYGKNPKVPFAETDACVMGDPSVKRWAYAISKMFEEQLCFAYRERYKIPMTVVRFFGGYGPGQHLSWWGGPQSVFIDAALRGEPMEIHGDGRQTRSFTFISDHVDGLIRCLESERADGEVFNLGHTRETSILELATLIWTLVRNDEPRFNMVSYDTFGKYEDVRRRVPDVRKARELLQHEALVELEEGLLATVEWQRALTGPLPSPA